MKHLAITVFAAVFAFASACKPLEDIPVPVQRAQEQAACITQDADVEYSETADRNITQSLSRRLMQTAEESRSASVHVRNVDNRSRGSGTYFEYDGHHIVITAGHVSNYSPVLIVESPAGEEVVAFNSYQEFDEGDDFSILLLTRPLETREPMELKIRERYNRIIGETLVYTGHPGSHESLTIFGQVAGFADNDNIIFHSYAWMGASGSAVFDERGRLIGVLRAVDFNAGPIIPQITEDMVWLSPATSIDLDKLEKILTVISLLQELEEE